ncbi:MAG: hypothetical protein U0570_13725 [Phycisphaerales bacterium]
MAHRQLEAAGIRRIAGRDTDERACDTARKRSKILEENRRFAWAWASDEVKQATGYDPMSANAVVPIGWPPGTDPSMDVTVLKDPPKLEAVGQSAGNPWA